MAKEYKKVCPICKEEFIAQAHNAVYCSSQCKQISYKRMRNKEKYGNIEGTKICIKCGKSFTPHENGYTRRYCFDCVPNDTYSHGGAGMRKLIKIWALEYKGDKCQCCGYNKCNEALEFHHIDKDKKDFIISSHDIPTDWDKIKPELDKCILVCSNCHREIHAGLREIIND